MCQDDLLLNNIGQFDIYKDKLKLDPKFTLSATYTSFRSEYKRLMDLTPFLLQILLN